MCCNKVVLPVRGGATIKPRCPLPIGVMRSITRVVYRSVAIRILTVDLSQFEQLRSAAATPNLSLDPETIAKGVLSHYLRSNENILRRLNVVAFRVAQKAKAFARHLNQPFTINRLRLRLFDGYFTVGAMFAVFGRRQLLGLIHFGRQVCSMVGDRPFF